MLLFRSEEDAHVWSRGVGRSPGAIVPLDQLQRLAIPWYGDRMEPDWRPPTRSQSQAILTVAGLTGEFWRLA
jgi:hypothetical protein